MLSLCWLRRTRACPCDSTRVETPSAITLAIKSLPPLSFATAARPLASIAAASTLAPSARARRAISASSRNADWRKPKTQATTSINTTTAAEPMVTKRSLCDIGLTRQPDKQDGDKEDDQHEERKKQHEEGAPEGRPPFHLIGAAYVKECVHGQADAKRHAR